MKKIAVLIVISLYLFNSVSAQEFRFGFQLSPTFTWLNTDDNSINGNGTNLGLKLAMMGEKYFGGSENYAFKFGIGFAFNQEEHIQIAEAKTPETAIENAINQVNDYEMTTALLADFALSLAKFPR